MAGKTAQQAIAADYITVAERIQQFYADNPRGMLVEERPAELVIADGVTYWVYVARATPDAREPERYSIGSAQERIPGLTPFTKGSELQNAETAAAGRAIALLGYATHGVATKEEVEVRDSERELTDDGSPTEEQKQELARLVAELDELREEPWLEEKIAPWVEANVGQTIEELNRGQFRHLLAKVERMVENVRAEIAAAEPAKDEES